MTSIDSGCEMSKFRGFDALFGDVSWRLPTGPPHCFPFLNLSQPSTDQLPSQSSSFLFQNHYDYIILVPRWGALLIMAENIPPGTASKPVSASADRPGLPYYEKLRRDLRDTLQKKRLLDRNLVRSISPFRVKIFI